MALCCFKTIPNVCFVLFSEYPPVATNVAIGVQQVDRLQTFYRESVHFLSVHPRSAERLSPQGGGSHSLISCLARPALLLVTIHPTSFGKNGGASPRIAAFHRSRSGSAQLERLWSVCLPAPALHGPIGKCALRCTECILTKSLQNITRSTTFKYH